jgi:uncharacterized protein YqhQ
MKNRRSFTAACLTLPLLAVSAVKRPRMGGQAIIEGVMMRGRGRVSWAVRNSKGQVIVESFPFISAARKWKALRTPVLRGAVNLVESLRLGLRGLSRSAELATAEEMNPKAAGLGDSVISLLTIAFSLAISFVFFLYLPLKLLSFVIPTNSALLYNLLAGALRMVFFLAYLWAIAHIKDVRRLFEYHGAEHKVIYAYEDGKKVTIEASRPYSTHHPRCGTSFLVLVALICILLFGVIDGLIIHFIGPYPTVMVRTLTHLALIPLVSGISFELLRLSSRFRQAAVVKWLIAPGLWLQSITTREPDDGQLTVAIQSLSAIL